MTTPVVGRVWCPVCEPLADPTVEILDTRYCDNHLPNRIGTEDVLVRGEGGMSGSAEAGGEANRAWCRFIHRNREKEIA